MFFSGYFRGESPGKNKDFFDFLTCNNQLIYDHLFQIHTKRIFEDFCSFEKKLIGLQKCAIVTIFLGLCVA